MKPSQQSLELADTAAALLKRSGFELRYVSMKSEACYYGWPGRADVIRVATHTQKTKAIDINGSRVLAKLTFRGTHLARRGEMTLREDKLYSMIALAIGTYFLRGAGAKAW